MSVLCQLRTLLLCVYVYYVGVPSKTRDNSAPHFLWISKHQCRTAAVQNGGSGATPVNLATLMGSSFSTCDNPRTSSQNHIPTGNLVYVCTKCTFFFFTFACPARPAAGRFSRSRLRGAQAGRVYITAQVWIPTGLRGARSGRSTPSIWHVITGSRSDPPSQEDHGNPRNVMFLFFALLPYLLQVPHQPSKTCITLIGNITPVWPLM